MSTYLNAVIRRTRPATRCQCAVLGVLNGQWSSPDAVWRRRPVYVAGRNGEVETVGYGTINAILRGLVQQGYAEARGGKRKQYRQA